MNQQTIIDLAADAALISMQVAAPALLAIMVTGFIVSLFQAATQINEQTLSFIPKILAMTLALFVAGPWIIQTMIYFTKQLFTRIPSIVN